MIRRHGRPPEAGRRYVRRPGAYAVVLAPGGVLLTVQQTGAGPDVQLPGGGIDPGEHPVPALRREVLEETGWTLGPVRRLGAWRRFTWMPEYRIHAEKVCTVYLARAGRALGPPLEPGHAPLVLPAAEALRRLGAPGDRAFLARAAGLPAPSPAIRGGGR
ncbi:MAG: NUDIX domain-containing protein [Hasllibacter sp.]